jgi:hypothetical protein
MGLSSIDSSPLVPTKPLASAIASSKSFASMIVYPPRCSRVSAKGPSVSSRLPSRYRMVVRGDQIRLGRGTARLGR